MGERRPPGMLRDRWAALRFQIGDLDVGMQGTARPLRILMLEQGPKADWEKRPVDHAVEITFERLDEEDLGAYLQPLIHLQRPTLQHLMDQLWKFGYRPEGIRYTGEIEEAVQHHLADMRALAAQALKMKLP